MTIKDLKLIGAKEVCQICKFSNQYLQYLILTSKIPVAKISGCWVFLLDDVLEFQKKRETKAKGDKRIKLKK